MHSDPSLTEPEDTGPARTLARANASRVVIQDYRPLAESLEWELGQAFYQVRGNRAFTVDEDAVPFSVHNDGMASYQAADLFHAALAAAPPPPGAIFVLEIGIGIGLFARFFLDRVRDLSARAGDDFYARLTYIAADGSEAMLIDACRHGVFADHAGHYMLRPVRVPDTLPALLADPMLAGTDGRPFRAVFFNYMLDCLPPAIFKFLKEPPGAVQLLHLRTCLARNLDLQDHTPLTLDEVRRLAGSADPADRQRLTPLFDLFSVEYEFRPTDPSALPFGDLACAVGRAIGTYCIHNYGAHAVLAHLAETVPAGGFILVNDYGYGADASGIEGGFAYQIFSNSVAIGLNIPVFDAVAERIGMQSYASELEGDQHFTRMLGRDVPEATVAAFRAGYGEHAARYHGMAVERAEQMARAECGEAEADAYLEALRRTPHNWVYLQWAATFLLRRQGDPANALALARAALRLNPACSCRLWGLTGEILQALDRPAEARAAFERALRINPRDARARHQLARLALADQDCGSALHHIAEALTANPDHMVLDALLSLQTEIVAVSHERWKRMAQRRVNRAGRSVAPSQRSPGAGGGLDR